MYPIGQDGKPCETPEFKSYIEPSKNRLEDPSWWEELQYIPPETSSEIGMDMELDPVLFRRSSKYLADHPDVIHPDSSWRMFLDIDDAPISKDVAKAVRDTKIEHIIFRNEAGEIIYEAEGDTRDEPDYSIKYREDRTPYREDTGEDLSLGEQLDLVYAKYYKIRMIINRCRITEPRPGDPALDGWYYFQRDGIIHRQKEPVLAPVGGAGAGGVAVLDDEF